MRYILDANGYIDSVSCTPFNCKDKSCKEYTGAIPEGYDSLEDWACNANIRAYTIVDGNLTFDSAKDAELTALYEQEAENNALAMRGWVNDRIEEVTSQSGHTHSNKKVLDGITSAKVSSWDNKLDSIPSEYVTESELTAKNYLTSIPSEYITESELTAKKYLTSYTETDPVFKASAAAGITSANITNWNNKSNFSGNYNDLTNKPTIPTVPTKVSAFTNDAGYLTEHQPLKTINGESLAGTGNITISSGGTAITPVTTIDENSTDEQIPSAKAVFTYVGERIENSNNVKEIPLSGLSTGSTYECLYFPATKMVWCSIYLTGKALTANTRATIATVPEGYRASRRVALAVDGLQDTAGVLKASTTADGTISILSSVAKESADDQYISGWWRV